MKYWETIVKSAGEQAIGAINEHNIINKEDKSHILSSVQVNHIWHEYFTLENIFVRNDFKAQLRGQAPISSPHIFDLIKPTISNDQDFLRSIEDNGYYIHVGARQGLPGDDYSVGHAFLIFIKEDAKSKISSLERAAGIYPNGSHDKGAVIKPLDFTTILNEKKISSRRGFMLDELIKGSVLNSTNRIVFRVDMNTYQRGLEFIDNYSKSYSLLSNNCMHFCNDFVNNVLGLKTTVFQSIHNAYEKEEKLSFLPEMYINGLINQFDFINNNGGIYQTMDGGFYCPSFLRESYLGEGKFHVEKEGGLNVIFMKHGKGVQYSSLESKVYPIARHYERGEFKYGLFNNGYSNKETNGEYQNLIGEHQYRHIFKSKDNKGHVTNEIQYFAPILKRGKVVTSSFDGRKIQTNGNWDQEGNPKGKVEHLNLENKNKLVIDFDFATTKGLIYEVFYPDGAVENGFVKVNKSGYDFSPEHIIKGGFIIGYYSKEQKRWLTNMEHNKISKSASKTTSNSSNRAQGSEGEHKLNYGFSGNSNRLIALPVINIDY